ncbi:MAG: Fic family protein [Methanosarcinales archaeon]|nr:Fic family protein [Methanosarcinales archaeon]
MLKLEIKIIKGYKYLYLRDKVTVNCKTTTITFYVGRLSKITTDRFVDKLNEFERIKLKTYTDYRLKKLRCAYLDQDQALTLERLRYGYRIFKEVYPDEFKRYEKAVFVHYAQGTTAIEGNTITTRQAEELFEHSITPEGKSLREVYELVNFEELEKFIASYKGDVSERLIKKMHTLIMRNLSVSSSEYRRIQVYIETAEYVPPPPFEIPNQMHELISWYRTNRRKRHPLELAIMLHTKFVTIHPFTDGNGRLGRALLNFVLQQNGYPKLFLDLGHREKYLDAVEEGNEGNYQPIIELLYEVYLEQHRTIYDEIIGKIRSGKSDVFTDNKRVVGEFAKIQGEERIAFIQA